LGSQCGTSIVVLGKPENTVPSDRRNYTGAKVNPTNIRLMCDPEVSGCVYGYSFGKPQPRVSSESVIAGKPPIAVSGYGRDDPTHGVYSSNAMIHGIADKKIAVCVHRHSKLRTTVNRRVDCRSSVPGIPRITIPRHSGDEARRRVYTTNSRVTGIRNIEIARAIDSQTARFHDLGFVSGSPVARETGNSGPDHCRYDAGDRVHAPHAGVEGVGDIEIVGGVKRDTTWFTELCAPRMATVARKTAIPVPGDDRQESRGRIDATHYVEAARRDVDVPGGIHSHTPGVSESNVEW
jgi:hypothetical protein